MSSTIKIALLVLIAIVLAVLARVVYVRQNQPEPAPIPTVPVRVSATNLPAGLLLRDEDLAWRSVPQGQVPPQAITERNADQWEGALLRRALPADTVITQADLLSPQSPGFLSAALGPDMRAVSIPIDDVSGNAGLIRPGDVVDLILTQDLRGRTATPDASRSVVSETVVEHARVIAVGSQITADSRDGSSNRARTITLELAPRAAEAVAVAARLGTLSLALRSFAVTDRERLTPGGASVTAWQPESPSPVWATDVSRAISGLPVPTIAEPSASGAAPAPAAPAAAPSEPREVRILRGSQGATTVTSAFPTSAAGGGATGSSIAASTERNLSNVLRSIPSYNNP